MWNAYQIISKYKYDVRLAGILEFTSNNYLKRRNNRQHQCKHRCRRFRNLHPERTLFETKRKHLTKKVTLKKNS